MKQTAKTVDGYYIVVDQKTCIPVSAMVYSTKEEAAEIANKINNRFELLAEKVAEGFVETMKNEGFETFKEMCDCYWWTTKDIKTETDYFLRYSGIENEEAYIDEFDMNDVICNYGMMPYTEFAKMFKKKILKMMKQ